MFGVEMLSDRYRQSGADLGAGGAHPAHPLI